MKPSPFLIGDLIMAGVFALMFIGLIWGGMQDEDDDDDYFI